MLVIFLISILRSEWRATRGTIQVNQQPMKDLSNRIFLGRDGSTRPCTRLSPRIPHRGSVGIVQALSIKRALRFTPRIPYRGSVGIVHVLSIKRECPHSPNPTSRQRGDPSSPFYKNANALTPRIPHRGSVGILQVLSIKRECPHSSNPTSRQRGDRSCPFYKTRMPSLPQSHLAAAWGSFKSFL